MKKVLIITPHLSTGGQPQYLLKKMQKLSDQYTFYVVEWDNITGGVLVVQRNQIESLLGDRFFSLGENKKEIHYIINNIEPDVIHFEEIPETFISNDVLDILYRNDRNYFIVSTTHSSFTNPSTIKYNADKYILVSDWSRKVFENHFKDQIPCDIWEYPTEKIEYDKNKYKKELGFDPEYKHVLHVGLFTPGKNQKSIVDLAKTLLNHKIKFHFVGNQADNFKDYWKPIMDDFPENCIWHGERSDVDKFYMASDLFYFPSNYELNPLALKEAISYGLPIFIKKLYTYENTYDDYATYISADVNFNKKLLLKHFNNEETKPKIQIIHLLTSVGSDRETESISHISKLSSFGIDYVQQINEVIDGLPPKEFCSRPHAISDELKYLGNGYGTITGRHYGCFLAHTNALKNIDKNYDYTLIFEGDANIETSVDEFVNVIYSACEISEKHDVYYISFANNNSSNKIKINELFSQTSFNQDLAHCYLIPNRYKEWYLNRIGDTKWDVSDIWYNEVFGTHPQRRYTTNKLYSNQIDGLSLIDKVYKYYDKPEKKSCDENILPILVLSTGRRLNYLKRTLSSLFEKNENIDKCFKQVWVLDDRSSIDDRYEMEKLFKFYFNDKYNTIYFNSQEPFDFVEKHRMLKHIIKPNDIAFLLEDDWECVSKIDIDFHVKNLISSTWTQIAFADPIHIQNEIIQKNYKIDSDYWKNPFPEEYNHPFKWENGVYIYNVVKMDNFTLNPSLIKGEVFSLYDFKKIKNFEADFADSTNTNQVFTQSDFFRHFGEESLIDKI